MVQDVDLPESKEKLANNGVSHRESSLQRLGRWLALSRLDVSTRTQLVGAAPCDLVHSPQVAKNLDQRARCGPGPPVDPLRRSIADPDHERAVRCRRDTRAGDEQRGACSSNRPSHLTEGARRE